MKKLFTTLLAVLLVLSLTGCGANDNPADDTPVDDGPAYKIAIVTGTVSQSEDDYQGACAIQAKYGEDVVELAQYPDNFTEEIDTVIATIVKFADDPKIKAIIVCQGVPGTTEAFRQVKEKRPDILCFAGEPQEDISEISSIADVAVYNDCVARGYLMIKTAHDLGCDTFVHVSFARHLGYETIARRLAIMKEACADLGMTFVSVEALDPVDTSTGGQAGAVADVQTKMPLWIEQYGQNAAYFCTNDAHTEPLLAALFEYGGYFIEADLPSPLMGYPGALGLDLTDVKGDFAAILKKVEDAVVEKGGAGKFGTWACSYSYCLTSGLAQLAIDSIEGTKDYTQIKDVAAALKTLSSEGVTWNGSVYVDANTGVKTPNVFFVYQDTYIMGKGFMGNTEIEVPEKYFTVK